MKAKHSGSATSWQPSSRVGGRGELGPVGGGVGGGVGVVVGWWWSGGGGGGGGGFWVEVVVGRSWKKISFALHASQLAGGKQWAPWWVDTRPFVEESMPKIGHAPPPTP